MAATNFAALVASLRSRGVLVFTYPPIPRLIRPRTLEGAFQFAINGPPGAYSILSSTNLADWSELAVVTNKLDGIVFTDSTAHLSPQKFYQTRTK
jgi:hypothetical protein